MAIEQRFAIDAIHLEQARLIEHHRSFHRGHSGIGLQFQTDGVGMGGALVMALGNSQAAVAGDLHSINRVRFIRERTLQHAGQSCVAHQDACSARRSCRSKAGERLLDCRSK